jgi:hypothetical protein
MEQNEIILQVCAEGGGVTLYGVRTKEGWLFSRDVIGQYLVLLDEPSIQHTSVTVSSWSDALNLFCKKTTGADGLLQYPFDKASCENARTLGATLQAKLRQN